MVTDAISLTRPGLHFIPPLFPFGDTETSMASMGATATQRQSYRGLRGWLETVDKLGELERVSGANWDVEMGAVTHMLTEKSRGQAPAILFDDVPGYPKGYRTLYGQLSSIKRIALTLGLAARIRTQGRYRAALSRAHAGPEASAAALRQ